MNRLLGILAAGVVAVTFSTTVYAGGNAAAGQKLALARGCTACHGKDGNSKNPMYPRLAGQYPDYIARALHEYQSGGRKNAIMNEMAKNLSAGDIANLAAYFSSQKGLVPLSQPDFH